MAHDVHVEYRIGSSRGGAILGRRTSSRQIVTVRTTNLRSARRIAPRPRPFPSLRTISYLFFFPFFFVLISRQRTKRNRRRWVQKTKQKSRECCQVLVYRLYIRQAKRGLRVPNPLHYCSPESFVPMQASIFILGSSLDGLSISPVFSDGVLDDYQKEMEKEKKLIICCAERDPTSWPLQLILGAGLETLMARKDPG